MPIPMGYRNIDQDKVDMFDRIVEIIKCKNCSIISKYGQIKGVVLREVTDK